MNHPSSSLGKKLAITGALLQVGPLIGAVGTVIGMMHAFDTLSASGMADPERLSASIGEVLISTMIGLVFGLVGLILLGVSIFHCGYRAAWLFWFLVILGTLLLVMDTAGLVFGLSILVFCFIRRKEFLHAEERAKPATPQRER